MTQFPRVQLVQKVTAVELDVSLQQRLHSQAYEPTCGCLLLFCVNAAAETANDSDEDAPELVPAATVTTPTGSAPVVNLSIGGGHEGEFCPAFSAANAKLCVCVSDVA